MVSEAVVHLPAAASLLLLEALFMQISGVSLTLTWPRRLCLLRVLLCMSLCYKLSPFQAHWGTWHCTHFLRPACLFTVHMGSGSSPLSCGVFLPLLLLLAFPLLVAGRVLLLLPSPAGLFIYSSMRDFPPPLHCSGHPAIFVMCLFFCYCLIFSFSFFLGGIWSVHGSMLIWSRLVCGSTACCLAHLVVHVFPSHQGAGVWQRHGIFPCFSF
jgi:hypothetical protein